MPDKITLSTVGSLIDNTTAQTTINSNFSTIQSAFDNTLSRDGTFPNQMSSVLDMNSNEIINLPIPISMSSPVRIQDLSGLSTGGTITVSPLPVAGTAGQVLTKNSSTNFDVSWLNSNGLPVGGTTGQALVKNSALNFDASWQGSNIFGGATNSIQYNTGIGLGGVLLSPGQIIQGTSGVPTAAYPTYVDVVSGFGIDNTGVTVVATALQAAVNTITSSGHSVYIPNGTYNMGSGTLTVPDGSNILCHRTAILNRTSDANYTNYTGSMVVIGNNVTWTGGTLQNSVILGTSTSSVTVGTGTPSFTTQAGLPIVNGSTFVRIWSASNPQCQMEGVVSTYSGTILTLNATFSAGSGTFTDWNITIGAVWQCPMVLHGVTRSLVEQVIVSGNWYVGLLMDGWNPSSGGSLVSNFNTFKDCFISQVQNRAIYLYGTCNDNLVDGCFVSGINNGQPGATDYGFNMNPANATGSVNSQNRNKITNCRVDSTAFQGYEIGDLCFFNSIENCSASNLTSSTGAGFLIQLANTQIPQYNCIRNCIAQACAGTGFFSVGTLYSWFIACQAITCNNGFVISPSGSTQSQFIIVGHCSAISSTLMGFTVNGNSNRCDLSEIQAVANSNTGVQINSGSTVTRISGRSNANTVANYNDNGTGTVSILVTA